MNAQKGSFTVSVDADTIALGDMIQVEFIMENLSGKFAPPDLTSFDIVGGPNTTSSFTMINGDVSQKLSYRYALTPKKKGKIYIEKATVVLENGEVSTEPVEIMVVENDSKPSYKRKAKERMYKTEEDQSEKQQPNTTKKRVLKRI
jgi:hypothetical protein